jgi:hypothetical protein
VYIQDPPIARFLFQSTMASWMWLIVCIGYEFSRAAGAHRPGDERHRRGHPRVLDAGGAIPARQPGR